MEVNPHTENHQLICKKPYINIRICIMENLDRLGFSSKYQ